jgi:hypothetical protein
MISHDKDSPKDALSNILFNIVIPVFILSKGSNEQYLGPLWGLIVALIFPLSYGIWDLVKKKKWNFIAILGLISVLLTGGLALFKLSSFWFAVKEAAIPLVIGIFVFFTNKTEYNLVKMIILNPKVLELEKIEELVEKHQKESEFEKIITNSTYLLVASFALSALLNFLLAIIILKSPTGTEAFNQELGRMTALSFPVIMVPSTIILAISLWYLLRGISKLTGVHINDFLKNH